jgi:hypothetical protein
VHGAAAWQLEGGKEQPQDDDEKKPVRYRFYRCTSERDRFLEEIRQQ